MDLYGLALAMVASAAVVLLAVLGVRFAGLIGVPGLLLYLGLGLVLGWLFPALEVQDAQLATVLGYGALVVILAEGGLTTQVKDLRPVLWPALTLATVGVAVSIAIVTGALLLFTDVDLRVALLIGAVLAATDAAAVFSVLRRLRLHPRLRSLLEAEAGFNDAPVVVLVVVLSAGTLEPASAWQIPLIVIAELVGGIAFGFAVGLGARWALPRLALPSVGLYPIAVMSVMALAYGAAAVVHASGFMAVYVAGVLVGSAEGLPHRRSVIGFAEGLAWAAQIGLFVMLGLLAQPEEAVTSLVPAAVAGTALVLFARPLSALVSLSPFRVPGLGGLRVGRGSAGRRTHRVRGHPTGPGGPGRECGVRRDSGHRGGTHPAADPAAALGRPPTRGGRRVEGDRAAGRVGPHGPHGRVVVGGGRR